MENALFESAANGQDNGFVRGLSGDGRPLGGAGSSVVPGTGVGGVFNLGQTNTVNALSVLIGSENRAVLVL
jgi:hypothetical protein